MREYNDRERRFYQLFLSQLELALEHFRVPEPDEERTNHTTKNSLGLYFEFFKFRGLKKNVIHFYGNLQ